MVDKSMLIGALATGLTQAALEGYFYYMVGIGKESEVVGHFPYVTVGTDYIPPGDVWISCAGVPLLFYAVGKMMKKDAAIDMAKGGAIYGASTLVGKTTYRVTLKLQGLSYQLKR